MYRENYTPERVKAGSYMAFVALFLWWVILPVTLNVFSG